MTAQEEQSQDELLAFIKEEVAAQQKRNRVSTIIGLALVAIVGGYMTVVGHFIRTSVLDPASAAQWVAYMTENNVPVLLVETEKSLTEQAPQVADNAMAGLMVIPGYIGDEARRQIDLAADDMLPTLKDELSRTLQAYFDAHIDDAAEFYAEHQDPLLVQSFVDQAAADIIADLDAELKKDSGHGVQHMVTMSHDALAAIDQQLAHLASADPESLSREDQLHQRLVVLCLHVLDDLLKEAGAEGELFDVTATL